MGSGMTRLLLVIGLSLLLATARAVASPVILVYGDSLSAGRGVPNGQTWVDLLRSRLTRQGYDYRVVNASISGETSHGGLQRIDATLKRQQPAIMLLALGGNDGLRALPPKTMQQNLAGIIDRARRQKVKVVLLGIRIPPNYGPVYTEAFHRVYVNLAKQYRLPWLSFMLKGVATRTELMQADGIHPTAAAQPAILDNVWPVLKPLL